MNNYPEASILYTIILLLWLVFVVLPFAFGLWDDLSKFTRNKLTKLTDEQSPICDKKIFRAARKIRKGKEDCETASHKEGNEVS